MQSEEFLLTLHYALCILHLFLLFPEGFRLFTVVAVTATVAGFELQLLAFDADSGAGGNGMGDEHVGTHHALPSDDGAAAQNGRAGIDGDMILDGGMTFLAPETLTATGGKGAQGHALVDLHPVTDDGGFADDDAGAVVDEEILADGGTVIGRDCVIGSNVFITHSIPACTTVSVKSQELQFKPRNCGGDCDNCKKPDPFWEEQK